MNTWQVCFLYKVFENNVTFTQQRIFVSLFCPQKNIQEWFLTQSTSSVKKLKISTYHISWFYPTNWYKVSWYHKCGYFNSQLFLPTQKKARYKISWSNNSHYLLNQLFLPNNWNKISWSHKCHCCNNQLIYITRSILKLKCNVENSKLRNIPVTKLWFLISMWCVYSMYSVPIVVLSNIRLLNVQCTYTY